MAKDKKPREGAKIKDSRFANFETDPRFRLPSKKNTKTTIDKRFSRMLKDDDFVAAATVDRYGRKLKTDSKKKALQRLYQEEGDGEGKDKQEDGKVAIELDDDDLIQRELRAADDKFVQKQLRGKEEEETGENYDPARGGGFSSSDDDSDEGEEAEEDEGVASAGPGLIQKEEVPTGEITNRIAVVNLDWDHIKSVDLFALFSSFVPLGGSIRKVSIYPSEFGKSRMQKEELEGPPKELFHKKKDDGDEDDFDGFDSEDEEDDDQDGDDVEDSDEEVKNELIQEGDDGDFDSDALRTYQLDRLRYYYAVMICSDPNTAHKIYEATDGSEYMSSSNFLDLRFIPDDVAFDDEPRDECDSVPQGFKPVDFVTDALQHSKVKLTWDMHPEEVSRKETISKAFSGSRADIAENDLKAYLASDSEDDDDEEDVEDAPAADDAAEEPKLSKKELARRKMRAALGLSEEPAPKSSKSAPVGDMEITFSSALSGKADKKKPEEETTIEKYKRKEKERKAQRKEAALAKREGGEKKAEDDAEEPAAEAEEDLGFNDPFFTSEDPTKEVTKSTIRKEERKKKREQKEAEAARNAAEKAQLELLMAGNTNEQAEHLDHFDMNEIVRAEKQKGKKGKKSKKDKEKENSRRGGLQEDFEMPVDDPRFKAVFESHEFAIDPSNPKFKATGAMKKILEEGRKKRKMDDVDGEGEGDAQQKSSKKSKGAKNGELSSLVQSVKKKTAAQ